MVRECLANGETDTASVVTKSDVGNSRFSYFIWVGGVSPGMPGDGWKLNDLNVVYNVYEARGSSSGHGTLGVQSTDLDP